ncbi:MAG: DNA repair and recombination protein RadA [Nanoarchaeota archaeon]
MERISDLPGIGSTTLQKLEEAGFTDVMSIATSSASILMDATGMLKATAAKAISAARSAVDLGFQTGEEFLEKRSTTGKITTGSVELDKLMGGGIETRGLSEFFGEFGSSKSQIGFQLCVNVQQPEDKGGLNSEVVFIDTEGTFRPERITQMADAKGMDATAVLKKIHVARALSSDHQMLLVEKIDDLIQKEGKNIKLVVVDSLTSLFRSEYAGRGTLADRQQKINKHLRALQRLADKFNLAVYMTNQVMANPAIFFGNPTTAIGGHIIGHASTYRVFLRKSKGGKRIARMIDSPHLPEGEAVFQVSNNGIGDAE